MKNTKAETVRITGFIDAELKARLKASLALNRKTFNSWLIEQAEKRIKANGN